MIQLFGALAPLIAKCALLLWFRSLCPSSEKVIEKYPFILCSYIIGLTLNFFIIPSVLSILSTMILSLVLSGTVFTTLLMNVSVEAIMTHRFRVLESLKAGLNAAGIPSILDSLFVNLTGISLLASSGLANLPTSEYITPIRSSGNFVCASFAQLSTSIGGQETKAGLLLFSVIWFLVIHEMKANVCMIFPSSV